jgi:hypothetical protein
MQHLLAYQATLLASDSNCKWYRCCAVAGLPGSGPLGAEAHTDWLGQPAHADALPASSLCVPGQSVKDTKHDDDDDDDKASRSAQAP